MLKNLPLNGSALNSPYLGISSKGSSVIKFEISCNFDRNSWREIRDASAQHRYTLSKTKKCDNVCTFKPNTLHVNIIGKKLMVYDVFQNTARPALGLPPLGEALGVAGKMQAMVLVSVNRSSSKVLNYVTIVSWRKRTSDFSNSCFTTEILLWND